MEENDDLFRKFPNWLRWICFLPFAIIGSCLFTFLSRFSIGYIGYNPDAPIVSTLILYAGIAGFLYILYLCIPKFKEIITGIFSLLFAFLEGIVMYLYIINNNWGNWDFFNALLLMVGCVICSICMFIEHGRLTNKSKPNLME